ncbi:MAG: FliM/FliN family flagellar motor C-terminal domain-containing protein [Planctomycetota bacterium]|nr:FliM/FliN family flagellar motor C-terminal domain-containing protein [Planctomycetota bacterium]MDA1177372.1 FliM/FliN family flagellar motor C-terminal domain-containing protein [Planctomycetota bacterium]
MFESPKHDTDIHRIDSMPLNWSPPNLTSAGEERDPPHCLVTLSLGRTTVSTAQVSTWSYGTVLACPQQDEDFVDVLVDGKKIGRGVPVIWQDRLCVRITQRTNDAMLEQQDFR